MHNVVPKQVRHLFTPLCAAGARRADTVVAAVNLSCQCPVQHAAPKPALHHDPQTILSKPLHHHLLHCSRAEPALSLLLVVGCPNASAASHRSCAPRIICSATYDASSSEPGLHSPHITPSNPLRRQLERRRCALLPPDPIHMVRAPSGAPPRRQRRIKLLLRKVRRLPRQWHH